MFTDASMLLASPRQVKSKSFATMRQLPLRPVQRSSTAASSLNSRLTTGFCLRRPGGCSISSRLTFSLPLTIRTISSHGMEILRRPLVATPIRQSSRNSSARIFSGAQLRFSILSATIRYSNPAILRLSPSSPAPACVEAQNTGKASPDLTSATSSSSFKRNNTASLEKSPAMSSTLLGRITTLNPFFVAAAMGI